MPRVICYLCGKDHEHSHFTYDFMPFIDNIQQRAERAEHKLDIAIEVLEKIRGTRYPNGVPDSILANEALKKMEEL